MTQRTRISVVVVCLGAIQSGLVLALLVKVEVTAPARPAAGSPAAETVTA